MPVELEGFPARYYMLIDSGADASCFPEDWAGIFGIELTECDQVKMITANGIGIKYVSNRPITATIACHSVALSPTFAETPIPVLGRDDFFDRFEVTINHRDRMVRLRPFK